jgi:hypothetical protein
LVVAGGESAETLDLEEEAPDEVALAIKGVIAGRGRRCFSERIAQSIDEGVNFRGQAAP